MTIAKKTTNAKLFGIVVDSDGDKGRGGCVKIKGSSDAAGVKIEGSSGSEGVIDLVYCLFDYHHPSLWHYHYGIILSDSAINEDATLHTW